MTEKPGGLSRPDVSAADAIRIAAKCYGLTAEAVELGSYQDRNYLLTTSEGHRTVMRIDNPAFDDLARDGQHAALQAYHKAGVPAAAVLPGINGELTQRCMGYAVRLSEFVAGETLVSHGYLSPKVLEEFGALAAASVKALAEVTHPGLERTQMWDMRVAAQQISEVLDSITADDLRARVQIAAAEAKAALEPLAEDLPVQVIHGDLTDDNVMARVGKDGRLHPHTVLDLGDLGQGWRVAEIAVTVSSLLHHDAAHPIRALLAVQRYHQDQPLTNTEARALWPLVVLRSALLVASGWRQLQIDTGNDYARDRITGEQLIFDAATAEPLSVMTEAVLAITGFENDSRDFAPMPVQDDATNEETSVLSSLIPNFLGRVVLVDVGIESEALAGGAWCSPTAEHDLIQDVLYQGSKAAVFSYGEFRLTRTTVDTPDTAATWPIGTEIHLASGNHYEIVSPVVGTISHTSEDALAIRVDGEWSLLLTGIELSEDIRLGATVQIGEKLGAAKAPGCDTDSSRVTVTCVRAHTLETVLGMGYGAGLIRPEFVPAWQRLTSDPARLLGLPERSVTDTAAAENDRRAQIFASAQERYYERPMQIERGWRHHLIDTTGRSYIDIVNNVTGLGHGHIGVADTVNRQIRLLNTNSRFLYRGLAEYSERLLALLPEGSNLDTVLLVNSGSEAVDLSLRLAQAATGRRTVVALREAYHGWTMASDAITTSAYDNPNAMQNRPDWVHVADVPNTYRGTYRGSDANEQYQIDLLRDITALHAAGTPVAAFICESVLGNAGGVQLPEGYLRDAYAGVRAAGGLCIADEVQVGFGRMGSTFWGFEQSGVLPDIVAIAKPMGNGFPMGGVLTSKKIADALAAEGQFFSSAGGSPLSCQVGLAVLDAMEKEQLQVNARVVGQYLADGFRGLAQRHPLIGAVHGVGLYLGVELVRDRDTREPADTEAAAICERMRELGVVVLTTSERSNVLKVKPPLTLTQESADAVLRALDEVLTTGW